MTDRDEDPTETSRRMFVFFLFLTFFAIPLGIVSIVFFGGVHGIVLGVILCAGGVASFVGSMVNLHRYRRG